MKPSLHLAPIASLLALCAVSVPLPSAGAQPNENAPATIQAAPAQDAAAEVTTVVSKNELTMTLRLKDADVVDALDQIATRGNLEIVVRGGIAGTVSLSSKEKSPEEALRALCKAANLSPRKVNGVWIIEKEVVPIAVAPKQITLELKFRDVPVHDLVEILAHQFHLSVQISADIKGKIALIRLSYSSPQQALRQIAAAADLELVEKDNGWTVFPKKPVAP